MRSPLYRWVALSLLLALGPTLGLSGASILTSNNPDASLSTRAQEGRRVELTVESTPSGAEVSLNGRPRGLTPLRLSNLSPGIAVVEVAASGYETTQLRLRLQGGQAVDLSVDLPRETGTLRIDVQPQDAEVSLSELHPEAGVPFSLPTGEYLLRVRRFGYLEQAIPVEIVPGALTHLRVVLEAAPFAVDLRETRDRGRLALRATAPGSALMIVRDSRGREVLRRRLSLEAPETRVLLPEEIPPGDYQVTLRARSVPGDAVYVASREVTVSTARTAPLGPWTGEPGLLYTPLPSAVPPGEPAVGTGWAYVPDSQGIDAPASAFSLASSVGVTDNLGLSFGAKALLFETQERNRLSFSLGVLRRLWEAGPTGVAFGGRATVDTPLGSEKGYRPDFFGTPEGVYLFLPASIEMGPAVIAAAPEVGFAWHPATWSTEAPDSFDPTGVVALRGGAGINLAPLFVATSGRLSLSPAAESGIDEPTVQIATEARLTIPRWGTAVSPFFSLAGPWRTVSGFFGLSVTISRY